MNVLCYVLGWKLLGKEFIAYSALATVGFSGMYKICEQFPHLWPGLADMPLVAALVGALFVGVGAGLCVRVGGAPSGDDALAMSISHAAGWKIQWVSAVGSDRAGHVLELYPGTAHRVFAVHRAFVRTADRVCTEL